MRGVGQWSLAGIPLRDYDDAIFQVLILLQTFWLFQTYLNDLSFQPASNAFQTCRRIYNKVQSIVFGGSDPVPRERIQDNVLPVTVLSSLVLASIAVPMLPALAGPLAIAQARRPRPVEEELPETLTPVQKIGRSHTVTGTSSSSRRAAREQGDSKDTPKRRTRRPHALLSSDIGMAGPQTSGQSLMGESAGASKSRKAHHRQSLAATSSNPGFISSHSLPDQRKHGHVTSPTSPGVPRRPNEMSRRHTQIQKSVSVASITRDQKIRLLRQNYFRTEMQFLTALEGISSRLVAVPKPARLSALRAELALIAQDLPAEVDVPFICPATLIEGAASKSKHHRIVRLNPAEATSLNSAAKVPYLLMLEVIHEDFDFDPDSEANEQLLNALLSDRGRQKRKLFDTSDAARAQLDQFPSPQQGAHNDSVFEPTMGDLGSPALLQGFNGDMKGSDSPRLRGFANSMKDSPRLPSNGVSSLSSVAGISTPRNSEGPISRSSTPGGFRQSPYMKGSTPDQAEVSALATHMRTAAQMLAQLELTSAKRPKSEVASIKAKIIASMQTLEEQSFLSDDALTGPSFDTIMAKANEAATHADASTLEDEELAPDGDPTISSGRGAARMENDMKTGGVQRKGDRDDPSAATFGEAWEQKKERIRRSSPYGWVKNWDLVSVIVKTGDDLRQEAFACQLIEVCSKIWAEHHVDVWVKNMRILVTGESSGLIETITDAVSLHSLKRSLTLAALAAAPNARSKGIATLQDHYTKTFGAPDSPSYAKATDNFAKSLAAYSIISYVLQLKDRHNGNILIDSEGHVIHIDFGFMLSNSPGNMGFEAAPFKFPLEYVELLGGVEGAAFLKFKDVLKDAFQALRREAERIVMLVELMGRESKMPSYGGGLTSVVAALRARFVLEKSKEEAREWVEDLVAKSVGSYYTRLYDTFQYRTQGIY